jgi:hypothetical protein
MARGGRRYRAGRPAASAKAEQALRLDVRDLAARGLLNGASFTWRWWDSFTGELVGGISVQTAPALMRLNFTSDGKAKLQTVPILRTACHLGGARSWLACPRCAKRVAVIYLRRGLFMCRDCSGVAYASQSESNLGRIWRRQRKLEAQLGPDQSRPRGMHWSTFERLLEGIAACEQWRNEALCMFLVQRGFVAR